MNKLGILIIICSSFFFSKISTQHVENIEGYTSRITKALDDDYNDSTEHEDIELSDGNYLDIRYPQMSTLDKFLLLGRAYSIENKTHNSTFEENYKFYKTKLISEDEKNITSPGYPEPYPIPTNKTYIISIESGTGIELIIHLLDILPSKDFLKITLETTENNENSIQNIPIISTTPIILTGYLKEPYKIRALACTKLTIEFIANTRSPNTQRNDYKGFIITYKPFGKRIPPPTIPPDVTVPFDDLPVITRLLIVERSNQTSDTWMKMKKLLCTAMNDYLNKTLMDKNPFESCQPSNVTFTNIINCPQNWADTKSCVEVYFAIQVYNKNSTETQPFIAERIPRIPAGFNSTELAEMWNLTGRDLFKLAGYKEYIRVYPNENLFLWMSIGVGSILVVFIIIVVVLKAGIIKNKWVALEEDDKKDLKNTNDIDITMYPSPDQVVPELFPGSSNPVYGSEIGYSIENGRIPSVGETQRSRQIESSQMIGEGYNPAYIDDDDDRHSFRLRVNGVNRDEANS